FGQGTANCSSITDLYIRNPRCAIVNDGNLGCRRRLLDLSMPGQRTKMQRFTLLLDKRSPGNEIQIHQVLRVGESELHQWNQALSARQQLRRLSQLRHDFRRLLERARTM